MSNPLRILLIEDNSNDAGLIEHELRAGKFSFQLRQVQTEAQFLNELETAPPDVIISDHGLPSFNGFEALEIVREKRPHTPFIFVSGSNDQGMVAEMYNRGATDYVFKQDLHDLREAVQHALDDQSETATPVIETVSPVDAPAGSLEQSLPSRLLFCPDCNTARSEQGEVVPLEEFCRAHKDTVVARVLCAECQRSAK